jgi:polyhydroxyalkanoate synthesis repressor PhaR
VPRVVKRYDNRKLYDIEAKRYVRLSDMTDLVRSGEEVLVIDNATGQDITAQTLSKAISEPTGEDQAFLPSRLLHEILRAGGELMTGGANQIEQALNRVIERSLERIGPSRAIRRELTELRERLARLEALVRDLESEEINGRNNDGRREHWRNGE